VLGWIFYFIVRRRYHLSAMSLFRVEVAPPAEIPQMAG
jgi:hypothetical protein